MVIFFKACASICFVLIAFFSYKRHPKDSIFFKSIFCGLIFCLFGDILITMSYIPVFFLLGIICFFICHLLFINGFCRKVPFNHKDISFDIARIDILDETIEEINHIIDVVKSGEKLEGIDYTNGNISKEI